MRPRSVAALVAASFLGLASGTVRAEDEAVRIGLVAPLTGDQAYIGQGCLNGAQMAVEDANIKGPVYGSVKVKLVPLDDQHNPTQAVLAANKLVADPSVSGVVGHFNSSCTKAASAIYHEARLAQVTPASTNPEISRQGFDTFFRACATDDVQAPAAADYVIRRLGIRRAVIIDDQTTYGKGLADEFEKKFKELGGEVLRRDGITQGEKDYAPLLTRLKVLKPELVFFGGVYPELTLLLKQSRKLGLKSTWMGGDGIFEASLIELAGPGVAEGLYATMLGVDPKTLPSAADFVKRYEARYGEIASFATYAYDATNIIIEAVRRAGTGDRQAVLAQVKKTQDHPGILGPINFDSRGDVVGRTVGIYRVEGGRFKFIEEAGS